MWQCIVDRIVTIELLAVTSTKSQTRHTDFRRLSPIEENAIRYIAGSVMKKVVQKYHSDSEVVHCLNSMLKDSDDIEIHYSEAKEH